MHHHRELLWTFLMDHGLPQYLLDNCIDDWFIFHTFQRYALTREEYALEMTDAMIKDPREDTSFYVGTLMAKCAIDIIRSTDIPDDQVNEYLTASESKHVSNFVYLCPEVLDKAKLRPDFLASVHEQQAPDDYGAAKLISLFSEMV